MNAPFDLAAAIRAVAPTGPASSDQTWIDTQSAGVVAGGLHGLDDS